MDQRAVKIIKFTISHEGGYANDPRDNGGETYRGISRKYHPDWIGWATIDQIKATRAIKRGEIFESLEIVVISFYYSHFWLLNRCDEITDLADIVFDMFVNHSPETVGRIVQKSLNEFGCNLKVDGIIGSLTMATLNKLGNKARNTIVDKRIEYYKTLDDFSWAGDGWIARARLYAE